MLFNQIRAELFPHPHIESMVNLTQKLVANMHALGIENIKPQTKKHIRRKLETEFEDSIEIISDDKGKLLVIPDNLTRSMPVKHNMSLLNELTSKTSDNHDDEILKQCAVKIRTDIKNSKVEQPWPPLPEKLDNEYVALPKSLTDFLKIILTGDMGVSPPSARVERLIQSFSQDCVYTITTGVQKPAKHMHILLPWTVKTLTGNVELIKILNRLGHGISYSQLEEIDTALCLQKLGDSDESDVVLPTNVLPGIPTTLAYDNIDRIEETLSGAETSHRVNGILVQPLAPTVEPPPKDQTAVKTRKRSINPPPLQLPLYNAGVRVGPPVLELVEINYEEAIRNAQMKNQLWSLVRQTDVKNQKVCSWTGFNILMHNNECVAQDMIGYLPTINAPATEMCTVYEILNQVLKILKKAGFEWDNMCLWPGSVCQSCWDNLEGCRKVSSNHSTYGSISHNS